MPSSLGYALLTVLRRRSASGYDLAAAMRRPVAYFWEASHSQIHSELRRLLDEGLIDYRSADGPGPHDKKVYFLTEQGRGPLRDWLTEPARPQPARDELVLKAFGSWDADPADAQRLFEQQALVHEEHLVQYEHQQTQIESRHNGAAPPPDHHDFGNYAALMCGLSYERHRLSWCRWMSTQLSRTATRHP